MRKFKLSVDDAKVAANGGAPKKKRPRRNVAPTGVRYPKKFPEDVGNQRPKLGRGTVTPGGYQSP